MQSTGLSGWRRRTTQLVAVGGAASCSEPGALRSVPSSAGPATEAPVACYSVVRIEGRGDGPFPHELAEDGRVLAINENATTYVWDGALHEPQLPPGFHSGGALDISDRGGLLAGYARDWSGSGTPPREPFGPLVWFAGADAAPRRIALPTGGLPIDDAIRINRVGHVSGTYLGSDGTSRVFLWRGGASIDLGPGIVMGLSNSDVVLAVTGGRAFVYRDGLATEVVALTVDAEDHVVSRDAFVNDRGQVAGTSIAKGSTFFWSDGRLVKIAGAGSRVHGLNDSGGVWGTWDVSDARHAFAL